HIGASAKLISSSLETYHSFGGALDIGALFIDERNDVNWGLAIRNIGTQFSTYNGTNEKLPLEIIAGVSQELENDQPRIMLKQAVQQWNIAFSNPARSQSSLDGAVTDEKVSFINNALRHVIVGVELFPKKAFNLRVGYNFRRAEELRLVEQRNFSGVSLGFGLKMNKLKFNYSYSKYTLAGNTSLFGLTMNFQ
ncbi:MAG TPA: type IX secretion system protein PorQ, partial [Flavobacterium sp.]|nr:type IX secretion system protein PorQ [Flavobacterium sp.]